MSKSKKTHEETIVEEARESFDLGAFLREAPRRTREVPVYLDEVTAEELGGVEPYEEVNEFGFKEKKTRSWGIVGRIASLAVEEDGENVHAEEIAELDAKAKILAKKLHQSGLVISLRSVPEEVADGARRAARAFAGIRSKSVTIEQSEIFNTELDAQFLARMVTSIKRNDTGAVNEGAGIESARVLGKQLPRSEYFKVIKAIHELQNESAIATKAIQDADF